MKRTLNHHLRLQMNLEHARSYAAASNRLMAVMHCDALTLTLPFTCQCN